MRGFEPHYINKIIEYYAAQKKRIAQLIPLALEQKDIDAIHDIRVAIKRIKSLFLFAEAISENKFSAKKNFRPFAKIFKPSGVIRDLQLQLNSITKAAQTLNLDATEYICYLKAKENQQEEAFINALSSVNVEEINISETELSTAIEKISFQKAEKLTDRYIASKIGLIYFLSQYPYCEKKWHSIRTHIKQLLYMVEVMKGFLNNAPEIEELYKKLKKFGEILGTWHDKFVAQENLREYINKSIDESNKSRYFQLLKAL